MTEARQLLEKMCINDPVDIIMWESFYDGPVAAIMLPDSEIVGVVSVSLSEDRMRAAVTVELADGRRVRLYFSQKHGITADVFPAEQYLRDKVQQRETSGGFEHEGTLWRDISPVPVPPGFRPDPFDMGK